MTESLVVTSRNETPAPGVRVVVHDASGAVIEETVTAADGTAEFDVPEGGMFTAAWYAFDDVPASVSTYRYQRLVTYHAVDQGATYELQLETREPEESAPEGMRFTFDVASMPAGASYLRTQPGCGVSLVDNFFGPATVFEVDHAGCPGFSEAALIIAAMPPTANGQPVGFYVLPPTTYQPGADVVIDLTAASFAPPISSTAPYTIDTYSFAGLSALVVTEDGQRVFGGSDGVSTMMAPALGDLVAFHPGNLELLMQARVNDTPSPNLRPHAELAWRGTPPIAPVVAFDDLVSRPSDVSVTLTPELARPTLSCVVPVPAAGDAMWMALRYYVPSESSLQWEHYAPMSSLSAGGLLSLQAPVLPADLQDFVPAPEHTVLDVLCSVRTRTGATGVPATARPVGQNELLRSQSLLRELDD